MYRPMYRPRLLGWQDSNAYHIVSRTTGRELLFGPAEREMFARMLDKAARFCGVEVLTWCCLSNHFHLLVRVSEPQADALRERLRTDPAALLEHLRILYKKAAVRGMAAEWAQLREQGHDALADAMVERLLLRVGDLSVFVKELKQRYSIWFNARHQRDGALWSARFRSVLVENTARSLRTVAAYIDLNAVRAGLATDPKDYRWCGYGQAMGGVREARAGLLAMLRTDGRGGECGGGDGGGGSDACSLGWRQAAEDYRVLMFGKAVELDDGGGDASSGLTRKGASPEEVAKVLDAGGKLPVAQLFRLRVRHLTDGTALGSKDFLQGVVENRPQQVSDRRKDGARPIRCLDAGDFASLRDLSA